ncbi:hypothetical protein PG993_004369 [Apiospora rasikravindrae]|uniref:Uncharacterized protein n=1 Tax=Apiospora rasikravindrae TaxID=990691 RepID=A0ABR1TEJ3_9PEZI
MDPSNAPPFPSSVALTTICSIGGNRVDVPGRDMGLLIGIANIIAVCGVGDSRVKVLNYFFQAVLCMSGDFVDVPACGRGCGAARLPLGGRIRDSSLPGRGNGTGDAAFDEPSQGDGEGEETGEGVVLHGSWSYMLFFASYLRRSEHNSIL